MKKYGFHKVCTGWYFQIGGVSGESFGIILQYFTGEGFRFTVNFNTDNLIKFFGFNQRTWGV